MAPTTRLPTTRTARIVGPARSGGRPDTFRFSDDPVLEALGLARVSQQEVAR
ncbi:hypothetical protein [Nonomuraea deserti]|uniref:hypothetical protein n=1 Tax=Nonomuraea deserti TaxID=1848322 RepID=UPI00140447F3|nr:hypothetical protein [Nonomuraea deserti]